MITIDAAPQARGREESEQVAEEVVTTTGGPSVECHHIKKGVSKVRDSGPAVVAKISSKEAISTMTEQIN